MLETKAPGRAIHVLDEVAIYEEAGSRILRIQSNARKFNTITVLMGMEPSGLRLQTMYVRCCYYLVAYRGAYALRGSARNCQLCSCNARGDILTLTPAKLGYSRFL